MSDVREEILARSAFDRGRPSNKVWTWTEKNDYPAITFSCGLKSGLDSPPARAASKERRRRRHEPVGPRLTEAPGFGTTVPVGFRSTGERLDRKRRPRGGFLRQLDRPQGVMDRRHVFRGIDLLMPEELRPRPVRSVSEVVCGALGLAVPPARRLVRGFPQEREASVDVAEYDHVADVLTSERASSRTFRDPDHLGSIPHSEALPESGFGEGFVAVRTTAGSQCRYMPRPGRSPGGRGSAGEPQQDRESREPAACSDGRWQAKCPRGERADPRQRARQAGATHTLAPAIPQVPHSVVGGMFRAYRGRVPVGTAP